jgi:hypothetical protein
MSERIAGAQDDGAAIVQDRILAALAEHEEPVFLDFDGTLLKGNSTGLFLASARFPLLLRAALLILDFLAPWRILPASRDRRDAWRDVLRVGAAMTLDPWLLWRWRRDGAAKAAARLDDRLLAATARANVIVVTRGFTDIIRPILAAGGSPARLVGNGWLDWRGRDRGKLETLRAVMDDADIARGVLVTDDLTGDADLAAKAGRTYVWPPPIRPGRAGSRRYRPFLYADTVKKGPGHTGKALFSYALPMAFIGMFDSVFASPADLILVALVYASVFCVYEIGYAENDRLATRNEAKPTFPAGYDRWTLDEIARGAWKAAIVALAAGLVVRLAADGSDPAALSRLAAGWIGLLATLRLTYALFNRLGPPHRIGPFFALQGLKFAGPLLVLGAEATTPGALLLLAHCLALTAPYARYRVAGGRYPKEMPTHFLRLAVFVALLGAAAALGGAVSGEALPATALALAWCLYKAAREERSGARILAMIGRVGPPLVRPRE